VRWARSGGAPRGGGRSLPPGPCAVQASPMEDQRVARRAHRSPPAAAWSRPAAMRALLLVAAGAAALSLTGCQSADPPSSTVATRAAAPQRVGTYDKEEVAVYHEAVRRLDDFEARNQRFLAEGIATRRALRFYRQRMEDWRPSFARLQDFERQGITIARRPVVLSTTAESIKSFQDNAAEVVLIRCTDQSDLGMTKDGLPVPAVHDEPVVERVVVQRSENHIWRIGQITTTDERCGRTP